jgi:hypothetical protein
MAAFFVTEIVGVVPMSLDPAAPYAVWSYLFLGTIVLMSAYGFLTSLAGRPIFDANSLDVSEPPARKTVQSSQ